jgi:hypothetical protein
MPQQGRSGREAGQPASDVADDASRGVVRARGACAAWTGSRAARTMTGLGAIRFRAGEIAVTFDEVRRIALGWPGVEEGTSYGTPALKVKGKLLTRLKEDGDSLVVKGVGPDERALLIETEPEVYYVTDHYRGWPIVLMRLSKSDPETVAALLLREWKSIAPKRLLAAFEAAGR